MPTPIRILILEDRVADAELILHELRRAGFDLDSQRVDSEPDYLAALETKPDLILADWHLPQFSGLRALQILQECKLDFPFIIISGSIGEEAAVEAIRQGAADYLLKDRLARLGPAVEHALYEKQLRDEKRQAEQMLYESEQKFRSFVEQSEDAMVLIDETGAIIEWNRGAERIFGLQQANVLGRFLWDIQFQSALPEHRTPSRYEQLKATTLDALKTGQGRWLNRLTEMTFLRSDGAQPTIQTMVFAIPTKNGFRLGSNSRDVTQKKQADEALQASELRYRRLFEAAKDGILILDANTGQIVDANPFLTELLGYAQEELVGKKIWKVRVFGNVIRSGTAFKHLIESSYIRHDDLPLRTKDGREIVVEFTSNVYQADHRSVVQCTIHDITERKRMERAIFLMSDTQRQIAHLDELTDIYQLVGQKIQELIGDGYVAVSMLDEQAQAMKAIGIYGLGNLYEHLVRTFKIDPSQITYPLKDMTDDELRLFRSGQLELFEGGLYNLLVRKVPRHICDAVERELSLKNIYTMGFTWQGVHFGGLTLLPKRDITPYRYMIETIINQAAIAIKRIRSEKALRDSEQRFATIFRASPIGIAITCPEKNGQVVDANPVFASMIGYSRSDIIGRTTLELNVWADTKERDSLLTMLHEEGQLRNYETRYRRKSGEIGSLLLSAEMIDLADGQYLLNLVQDITERKQAEEAQRQSEALFHSLVESLPQNIFSKDMQGRFTFANRRYCHTEGLALTSIIGKTDFDLHPPELAAKYQDDDRRVIETGQILDIVEEHQPLGKDKFYVQVIKAPLDDGKGNVAGVLGIFWDITARRQAEETLHLQSTALESVANAIAITDHQGIIQWVNPAFTTLTGYAAQECYGHNPRELLRSGLHDKTFYKKLWDTILAGQVWRGELINRRKDGTLYTEEQIITPVHDAQGNIAHFVSIKQDITERKQAEEALKQRAVQLLLINDISKRVASVIDLDDLLDITVSLIHESFGYEHVGIFLIDKQQGNQLVMKAKAGLYAMRFSSDHRLKLGQGMVGWVALYGKKLLANDVSTEMRFHDPFGDGSIKSELSMPIRSEQGNVGVIDIQSQRRDAFSENDVMVMETLADVLAAAIHNAQLYQELEFHSNMLEQAVKERTGELSRTKDHIEAILNSVGEGIIVFGIDHRIHQVNPTFERLTGYSAADIEAHRYDDPEVALGLSEAIFEQISGPRGRQDWHGEMQIRRRDGTTFESAVSISPVLDDEGQVVAFVGALRDISPLKEVERMKDAFVSNVSHELRTPITSLKLLHHLLENNPPKQSSYLEQMGRVVDRLNILIEDLLRLSRLDQGRIEMNTAPISLNALVTQHVNDLTLLAESRQLALLVETSPGQPATQADAGLLSQVLSVLLTNAFNYTPAGGQVVVRVLTSDRDRQSWVGFSVSDTGPGIPPEEQQQLFQRFFRGSAGRASGAPGTGLGLAIAKEIVQRHGGLFEVKSDGIVGKGTVFTVWLPENNKTPDKPQEESSYG